MSLFENPSNASIKACPVTKPFTSPTFVKNTCRMFKHNRNVTLCRITMHFWSIINIIPSNRRHLSCDDCLEDKSEDNQNYSMPYCVPHYCTHK